MALCVAVADVCEAMERQTHSVSQFSMMLGSRLGTEHALEVLTTVISQLLDGSPGYSAHVRRAQHTTDAAPKVVVIRAFIHSRCRDINSQ